MGEGWKRACAAAKATRKKPPSNRFAAFNPEERVILETLLQDHANSVSVISQSVEGPIDIHAYLATIEALENECRRS